MVKVENGLGMGSKMSPALAKIIMKGREEEKIDKERKIRKFGRYVDDSLGIWKEEKNRIGRKVDEMEEKGKGIELKLEEENEEKITFLDIKLQKKPKKAEKYK